MENKKFYFIFDAYYFFSKRFESKVPLLLVATVSLAIIGYSCVHETRMTSRRRVLVALTCLYFVTTALYHIVAQLDLLSLSVHIFHFFIKPSELFFRNRFERNLVAQVAYVILFVHLVASVVTRQCHASRMLANSFLMLNCLVQPSHNLLVILVWQLLERTVRSSSVYATRTQLVVFYFVAAKACFFSQGNTNSLNTVPIASGLVGFNSVNEPLVALLIVCATNAAALRWLVPPDGQTKQRPITRNLLYRILLPVSRSRETLF